MPVTVVLAVGLDSSLLAGQSSVWRSAGFIVTSTGSISEAIGYIRNGDFDLVLLGHSIPTDSRERLTFLIRATGSRTPVISITDCSTGCDSFADATIRNEPSNLLQTIGELMAERAKSPRQVEPCRVLQHERHRHGAFKSAGVFENAKPAEATGESKLTGRREIDASLATGSSPGQN